MHQVLLGAGSTPLSLSERESGETSLGRPLILSSAATSLIQVAQESIRIPVKTEDHIHVCFLGRFRARFIE